MEPAEKIWSAGNCRKPCAAKWLDEATPRGRLSFRDPCALRGGARAHATPRASLGLLHEVARAGGGSETCA
eukprot:1291010-Alexandrium_andersonii.AAC.1